MQAAKTRNLYDKDIKVVCDYFSLVYCMWVVTEVADAVNSSSNDMDSESELPSPHTGTSAPQRLQVS